VKRFAQDDGFVRGLEIRLVGVQNTKRPKKSPALRITALFGGLKYSWLDGGNSKRSKKSQALRMTFLWEF
jgi:hypothetical protein